MAYITLAGFGLILFNAAFWYGAVLPSDWNVSLAAIGALGLVFAVSPHGKTRIAAPGQLILLLCAALLVLAILQLVPLPLPLLGFLSPVRKEMVVAAVPVLGPQRYAPLSALPRATVDGILQLSAYLLIIVVFRQLASQLRGRLWLCAAPLIFLGTAEAGLGLFQYYAGPSGTAQGTYASRDHYAALLEMTLPFAVMWAIELLRRRRAGEPEMARVIGSCILLAAGAVMLLAVIHSLSRMGFIGALLGLFSIGALASVTARRSNAQRRVLIAALTILVLLAFIFLPVDPLIARFGDLAKSSGISADTRVRMWQDTLALIRDFPFFGCGLGAYESCFLRYKTVAPMQQVEFAHNDYLQLAAEIGIPGFMLVLTLAALAVKRILLGVRGQQRYIELACFGAMVGIGVHSFVDFGLHVPANAMTLAWIIGMGSGAYRLGGQC